jgi:alpha-maltose-1-phosphate synthase
MNYSTFVANAAMVTSVDVDAAAHAIEVLIADAALRRRMGEAGQAHAREVYDWKTVIAAYEQLWEELAVRRTAGTEIAAPRSGSVANPLCGDPFHVFSHYTTGVLTAESTLAFVPPGSGAAQQALTESPLCTLGREQRAGVEVIQQIIGDLERSGTLGVAEILQRHRQVPPGVLLRTLVHLVKFNRVNVLPALELRTDDSHL